MWQKIRGGWTAVMLLFVAVLLAAASGCETPQPTPPKSAPCVRPKVLAFTATWCGPCQRQKPLMAQIKAAGVEVQVIDIDEQPDVARQYGVTAVPTFIFYLCGRKPYRTNDATDILVILQNGWRR